MGEFTFLISTLTDHGPGLKHRFVEKSTRAMSIWSENCFPRQERRSRIVTGNLFAYGTLMLPDVLEFILERSLPSEPATLGGFSRYMVRDRVFPAVIPDGKHDVHGLVLFGLT